MDICSRRSGHPTGRDPVKTMAAMARDVLARGPSRRSPRAAHRDRRPAAARGGGPRRGESAAARPNRERELGGERAGRPVVSRGVDPRGRPRRPAGEMASPGRATRQSLPRGWPRRWPARDAAPARDHGVPARVRCRDAPDHAGRPGRSPECGGDPATLASSWPSVDSASACGCARVAPAAARDPAPTSRSRSFRWGTPASVRTTSPSTGRPTSIRSGRSTVWLR